MTRVRLDSWKTIADHLDRSLSTVQRWQHGHGLPVYHVGGKKGSVFAYTDELEAWFNACRDLPERVDSHPCLSSPAPQVRHTTAHEEEWAILCEESIAAFARKQRARFAEDPADATAFAAYATSLVIEGLLDRGYSPSLYARAASALRQAQRLAPQSREVHRSSAWTALACHHDHRSAQAALNALLADGSGQFPDLLCRALLLVVEGALEPARLALDSLWRAHSLSGIALAFLAWAHYLHRRYEPVFSLAAQSRASGESNALLECIEALALLQSGSPADILDARPPHLRLSAEPIVMQGVRAFALARAGRWEEAKSLYQDLVRRSVREDANYGYPLALCSAGMEQPELAARWLARCRSEGPIWSLGLRFDPAFSSVPPCLANARVVGEERNMTITG